MISLATYLAPQPICFIVIKPGFLSLSKTIINRFEEDGWMIYKTRTKQLLLQEAHRLYAVHKKEDFYDDLCKYMASGPSMGILFVKKSGDIKASLKEVRGIKDEIRDKYAESDMRNVMHSSDSYPNLTKESKVYF